MYEKYFQDYFNILSLGLRGFVTTLSCNVNRRNNDIKANKLRNEVLNCQEFFFISKTFNWCFFQYLNSIFKIIFCNHKIADGKMKASARTKAEFWVGYWFATKHIKHWIEIWRTRANRERIENRMMQVSEWERWGRMHLQNKLWIKCENSTDRQNRSWQARVRKIGRNFRFVNLVQIYILKFGRESCWNNLSVNAENLSMPHQTNWEKIT